jgi:cell division protein FtsW
MTARIDYPLVMTWLLILALGAVMVTSAGVATHPELLPRHGVYLALALWQATHRLAWVLAAALCALVLVPGVGSEVNGALRWIAFGPAKVQPAELAKFLLLIYLAGYLTRFAERIADEPWVMVKPLGMVGIIAALLLAQPDFGTAVVLASTACGLLFITGARLRHFLMIVILAGGGLLLIAYQQPYRLSRLITFTDPWAYATDGGYQLLAWVRAFRSSTTCQRLITTSSTR